MGAGETSEVGSLVGGIARRWVEGMVKEGEGEEDVKSFVERNAYFIAHEEEGAWKRMICKELARRKMHGAVEAIVGAFPMKEDALGVLVREGAGIMGDAELMRMVADEVEEGEVMEGLWVKEFVEFRGEDGEGFLRELAAARMGTVGDAALVEAVCKMGGEGLLEMAKKGVVREPWWIECVMTQAMEGGNEQVVEVVGVQGGGAWEVCFKGLEWLGDKRIERGERGVVALMVELEAGEGAGEEGGAVERWVLCRKGKENFDEVLKEAVEVVGGKRGIELLNTHWGGRRADLVGILRELLTKSTEGDEGMGIGKAWDKIRMRESGAAVEKIKATGWNNVPPSPLGVIKKVKGRQQGGQAEGESEGIGQEGSGEGEGAWDLVMRGIIK